MSAPLPMPAIPSSLSGLSPLKLALLARQVRAQSEPVLRADPIAIIGMGCRLPGGVADPQAFWRLLRDGVDAVCEVPPERWNVEAGYDPDPSVPGKSAARTGGFLGPIDGFDAAYFGILPREAERMDPQQRLFLEVAIEALDHAGLPRERLAGSRTGAFVASYYNDYAHLQYNDRLSIDARTLTGTVHSVLVNRLSYLLDLRGPSVSVDTACSSSLVAIHLACQSLRHGESDIALAGGVSLMVTEGQMISLSKVGFMAPDGRCKTFDASADGFGRGEGCSLIVMKRLSDAVADGDRVLAIVRGSAVNQDGHSTVLAAPNGLAQQALIREALANAQLDPSRIGYVEAHGTGTTLGDPIEVEALAATVGQPAPGGDACLMGAAKANLGHLEAAAGATGVIKSVLMFQHAAVPPQVHFKSLSPHISLAGTRLQIPTHLIPWPAGAQPRCIGTSGFGVGGTNAHVILEEAPSLGAADAESAPPAPWLLPLSAQSPAALRALAQRWLDFLADTPAELSALCATAGERRSHYDHRLAAVAGTIDDLRARLRGFLEGAAEPGVASGHRSLVGPLRVAFVFSGQGQQWVGMGRELLDNEPVFRDTLADIDARLQRHVTWSLLAELAAPAERSRLDDTEIAQAAIFAVQVGLAALWASWGIRPDGVVGHSIGEIAALHIAGALSLDEALRIVVQRGRIMQQATGQGAMAAVGLTEAQVLPRLQAFGDRLSIGAINSPHGVVLSGEAQALAQMLKALDRAGVSHRTLPVNYAFHSAQMRPHAQALTTALGRVESRTAQLPVYSTVSGALLDDSTQPVDAAYLGRNVREPVRFAAAIDAMLQDGFTCFVEISAHPVLGGAVAECVRTPDDAVSILASLRRARPEREAMLQACAGLYAAGRQPDWPGLQRGFAAVLDLPAYPWQRERFWLRTTPAAPSSASRWPQAAAADGSLLGRRIPTPGSTVFEASWPSAAPAWLADHRIGTRLLMPGMAMLDALHACACDALGNDGVEVSDFVIHQALVLDETAEAATLWQTVAQEPANERTSVALYRAVAGDASSAPQWQKVASATAARDTDPPSSGGSVVTLPPQGQTAVPVEALYAAFAELGAAFGPSFRTIEQLAPRPGGASVWLKRPGDDPADTPAVHPAVLDGALQACVAAMGGGLPNEALLPLAVESFRVLGPVPARVCAELSVERAAGASGSLLARIELRDLAGRLVALIDGVRLVPASAAAMAGPELADDWLHEVVWQPAPESADHDEPAGAWILLCDRGGAGAALAHAMQAQGHVCLQVFANAGATPESLERGISIDPIDPAQFQALLEGASWRAGRPLSGVVHLWSLDSAAGPLALAGADDRLVADDVAGTISALHLLQAMARNTAAESAPAQLVFVTSGAQAAGSAVPRVAAAGLWGLASAAAVEHPELALRAIDLDPDVPEFDMTLLAAELRHGRSGAPRLALRGRQRCVPELVRRAAVASHAPVLELAASASGTLDDLAWRRVSMAAPGPGEVALRVVAAGVNFRDVLMALAMIPGQSAYLGAECAGVVSAVGAGVEDLKPGDAVFGFAPRSLASEVNVPAAFVTRWPDALGSMELAASMPAAFLTAMLGLQRIAKLQRGQRVLIHAAAGGVGMAAVQWAQRAGAIVFATAGSPAKRELLRAMGVAQVFDSRSLDFADRVREATGGAGVNVVLNSLAGEFIGASVSALAPDGCFLELGKRDLWSDERFREQRPHGRYHVYDLGDTARAEPAIVRPMLDELLAALADGSLRPLPLRVFDFAQAPEAFRLMAQARHTGKLVLRAPAGAAAALVRPDASYWITGGLGALGLQTARWLVQRGARHLVLSARHAPGAAALAAIADCEALGATVQVRLADSGDATQMQALADEIARTMPALRGVVHAAGRLDDGILLQQDATRFAGVLRGKAHGARILDALTRDLPLDFFILYSAVGLLLGPAGQASYAAANAELDALAHARRAAGRPALSVAWSLWRDAGMAAAMAAQGHDTWSARGLGWIDAAPGFARLERLLREGATHAAVLPIDWARFLSRLPKGTDPSFFRRLSPTRPAVTGAADAAAPVAQSARWRALPESQRRTAVISHLREQALQVLGLAAATAIDPRTPLKELGLDSLMAVELRNLLTRSIGTALPATLLFDHPSLDAMANYLLRKLELIVIDATPASPAPSLERDAMAELSEDEAEAQLLAELDGTTGRSFT